MRSASHTIDLKQLLTWAHTQSHAHLHEIKSIIIVVSYVACSIDLTVPSWWWRYGVRFRFWHVGWSEKLILELIVLFLSKTVVVRQTNATIWRIIVTRSRVRWRSIKLLVRSRVILLNDTSKMSSDFVVLSERIDLSLSRMMSIAYFLHKYSSNWVLNGFLGGCF